jgi:signal transduction histidine kinase
MTRERARLRGVRLRLRTRLSLAMAGLVAGAVSFTAWATLSRVEGTFSSQFEERVDALLEGAEDRLIVAGDEVAGRMAGLRRGLLQDRPLVERLLVRPEPSSTQVIESAARMRSLSGLDLLEILDGDGIILSSGHWPERVGFSDAEALDLPEREPVLRRARTREGVLLAVLVRETATVGNRRSYLVGGNVLAGPLLDEMARSPGDRTLLVETRPDGITVIGGWEGVEPASLRFDPSLATAIEEGMPARGILRLEDGSEWSAGSLPLRDSGGELLGTLLVVADRAALEALLARLRGTFLAAGSLGTLLAALVGLWAAKRITQPLAELVEAVEAIALGRQHPFPMGGADEIGNLMTAFDRMHRSLRSQQQQLLAAERVAAWKEVAQRVAHEVKNPLSPIRLTVENMIKARRQAPELFDEVFDEGSRAILEEVAQLGNIVTEFSEFARLPALQPESVDLDALVDSVLALYAKEPGLTVERTRGTELPRVTVDPAQISRALKNLMGNAAEAMAPDGGVLAVRTGREGEAATVEVSDTGPGFPQDAGGKIFEPYFTTKQKGTGLGMAIALRIISDHGGSLSAANREKGGARVTVTLPLDGGAS